MFLPIRYLRRYVYPRGRTAFCANPHSRAADAVLGMAAVLLTVLVLAYALTALAGL